MQFLSQLNVNEKLDGFFFFKLLIKAVYEKLDELFELLDKSKTNDTRTDAEILLRNILSFTFIAFINTKKYLHAARLIQLR
jgi:hypothetical protein